MLAFHIANSRNLNLDPTERHVIVRIVCFYQHNLKGLIATTASAFAVRDFDYFLGLCHN